ncbi:bifunctional hydroxymethylpyrimidine kinase/phosphomethylpyrimidine kinase [Asticcacaulis excentricus]|uniref:hydroxymethylpyrimidine kinase n=1 Tax=Asticcacaulis excentricus (strain ATCC 15261 / DSM 4724 / KCTC 12464 / NCIMB 9791 / VKM B-1370 / CB 48) TaxID=573065 RepID=E8RRJ6_ASTEC|nr:bifunctional hydroxymethylpyrimidine kinase/phosphomethylpyrimidine kinase [Asticcacaulis excentricus]ADU13441.1 phosphomethylpyrimidine kinase [Asticcacaulis excentricus CB 48]
MRRVLIIAGSDPSGGAGIQADLKTVTCLGGYAMTAITALTVQNTLGVTDVMPVPEALITAQAEACLSDIGADAVKTGMLGTTAVVETVAALLDKAGVFAVVDPVMVAKGGHPLLVDEAIDAIRTLLIPRAGLLTPNAPEAAVLTGIEVVDEASQQRAGEALLNMGAKAVLMKGGHIDSANVVDWLLWEEDARRYVSERIETRHTHGTGCTLASACAVLAGPDRCLADSVEMARDYVMGALVTAPNLGGGHGPLRHNWVL